MKNIFIMIMVLSILNFDCWAGPAQKTDESASEWYPLQERFIIRIPGREEIPMPMEELTPEGKTESIEENQPQPPKEKNSQDEPKIEPTPTPTPEENGPVPQDEMPLPETPKNDPPLDVQEDEKVMVITPTRTKQLLKDVGSSVSIITEKDIENSKSPLLLDVLRQTPGLEVTRTGPMGGVTSLFLRGASSAQTLVFVDGVRMNSPTAGGFDFANLTTDNIERVEILRGPQSTLYGSAAMGGVVNIITKKGAGDTKVTLGTEYGMRDTYRESINVSGGKEKFDYSIGASYLKTHGISQASSGSEKDGYENFTGSARLGWNFLNNGRIDTTIRGFHSDYELDGFSFAAGLIDDPDRHQTTDEILFSTKVSKTFFDLWTPSFLISVNDTDLKGFDPTDESGEFHIPTRLWRLEHQSDFSLFEIDTVTVGYEYEIKEGENAGLFDRETFWNNAVFAENQIKLFDSLTWTIGIRRDDYSTFGNHVTYRTTASYNIEEIGIRFHSSWGTGFRAPSINELFYPYYGNPDLKPEESKGWDFGVGKELLKGKLTMDITYFKNDFDNLITPAIQPDGSYMAENIAKAVSEGIEAVLTYKPFTKLSLTGTYTYTDTRDKDKDKDRQLPRRPRNRATLGIDAQPLAKLNLNITGVMDRDRIDSDGKVMDNYWTVNLATRYDITQSMTAYVRFENLFDYHYEEVPGYGSLGFTAYCGLEFKF
ncbi:MAG: TonB-dependent receptor [Candidatus Brocadia sp.]|nr:TonB-dependent receptor [Candidatus Brocadia sp.]